MSANGFEGEEEERVSQLSAEGIRARVSESGGVLTLPMGDLLPAVGRKYMSESAPELIQEELFNIGVRHYPRKLPEQRWALIRLYIPETRAGELVQAVLDPSEVSDEVIREVTEELRDESAEQLDEAASTGLAHERVVAAVSELEPVTRPTLRVAAAQVHEVATLIERDSELRPVLEREGIRLQAIGSALAHALPDVEPTTYGFLNLKEFLQCSLAGTQLAVAIRESENPHARLVRRDSIPVGMQLLPDLEARL